jgi:hypothetical protein
MIATTAQKTALATVTHEDYFTWVPYGLRLGFLQNDKYVFKNDDGDFKRKAENVIAFYFGFSDRVAARKFELWIRKQCIKLNAYQSHCVVREGSRLTTAFEVKVRNLDYEILFPIFKELVIREIEKGSIEFDYESAPIKFLTKEEVSARLKRL